MIRLTSLKTLAEPALSVEREIEAFDIYQWAKADDGGGLPPHSAQAFGRWLEDVWSSYAEDTGLTVGQALAFALEQWKEGGSL